MKSTLRSTILTMAVIGVGFFLTGCNTVAGTMHGAEKDVKVVGNAMSNDHGTTRHHHVNKKKHNTVHQKSMKKHTIKSDVDSKSKHH